MKGRRRMEQGKRRKRRTRRRGTSRNDPLDRATAMGHRAEDEAEERTRNDSTSREKRRRRASGAMSDKSERGDVVDEQSRASTVTSMMARMR
jgi:hypothetical protein